MATANGVVEAITPIARRLLSNPEGTSADYLYDEAFRFVAGSLQGLEGSRLGAVLTQALRAAGGFPTAQTRRSIIPTSRGRRVVIWKRVIGPTV